MQSSVENFQECIRKEVNAIMNINHILEHIIRNNTFERISRTLNSIFSEEIVFNFSGFFLIHRAYKKVS